MIRSTTIDKISPFERNLAKYFEVTLNGQSIMNISSRSSKETLART